MFSQPSKALHSMALEYGVRLLYHKSWAFADGQTQRHSRCTVTLPPEECQCGKAAGGCSSRPAFFREKIFDFHQYIRMTLPPEECQCGKAAGGCSSRPAFFREKIFDFLQFTTKVRRLPIGKREDTAEKIKYPPFPGCVHYTTKRRTECGVFLSPKRLDRFGAVQCSLRRPKACCARLRLTP